MATLRRAFMLVLLGALSYPLSVSAHHGYAAYDMTQTLTLTGTVAEVVLANPHSSLAFDVKDDKGNVTRWAIEFGQLRAVVAQGWTKETLKPGDQIKVSLRPAKNGAHVGVLSGKIAYADGRPLGLKASEQ